MEPLKPREVAPLLTMFFQGPYCMLLFQHMGSSSLQWHSSWPLLLTASALAALGLPYGHRRLWTRPGLSFLFPLLTAALIPFHGGKTSDPELFPQGCQPTSCLQKADGVRLAQHRRADRR